MDIYETRRQNLQKLVTTRFNGRISGLAEAVERAPSYISRCLSRHAAGRKRVGEDLAREIESRLGLERLWLDEVRQEQDLQVSEPTREPSSHPGLNDLSIWDDETPIDDDEVAVPFLREVELAAGSGRFAIEESEKTHLRFGKRSLRHNGVQFDQAKCVTVRGNSMVPVLRDGATVGVNTGKRSIGDIVDGDLYAINHNGQLRVKQVYRLPTGIRLRSFNRDEHPDEDYSFQQMQEEQISLLGHVFWWGMFAR